MTTFASDVTTADAGASGFALANDTADSVKFVYGALAFGTFGGGDYQAVDASNGLPIAFDSATNLPDTSAGDLAAINAALAGTLTVGSHAVTNAGTFAVQVDAALPAGTNAIGKLAANDGVDIGDVTINNASLAVTATALDVRALTNADVVTAELSATDNAVLDSIDGAVNGTLTVGSHDVTNAGTFAVQEDGAALTALQLLDDTVYTDGTGTPSKGLAVMGTDGTNPQLLSVDTSGHAQVDVLSVTGTVTVDGSGVTQPVSAASLPLPSGAATETTLDGIKTAVEGTVTVDASGTAVPVTDNGGSLTVDGTVTANLGATDNAVLDSIDSAVNGTVTVDGSAVTQPISAASLPLPTGAATAANQTSVRTGSLGDGEKDVAIAGTAEALATSTACRWVAITAKSGNTNNVYVGGSGVASTTGTPLAAGDSMTLEIDNLDAVFIDADTSTEGVTYTYGVSA